MSQAPARPPLPPIVPVVLAGGSGTRLWPLSRDLYPKQFLSFAGRPSPLQQTLRHLENSGIPGCDRAIVVCNEEHRFLTAEQAGESGCTPREIVLEPEGRNTAPALAVAAARAGDGDPILVVLPADHEIREGAEFIRALCDAVMAADQGSIVTLGAVPTRAETGYGYIRYDGGTAARVSPLLEFVEKPAAERARAFLESGDYLWNSSVFVLRRSVWHRALGRYRPDIQRHASAAAGNGMRDGKFFRVQREEFLACPRISIDYAVMEPASTCGEFRCAVVKLDSGWSDLGSWQALWESEAHDGAGNACIGDVIIDGTRDSLVHSSGRLVAVLGGERLAIIETPDAVLVASLDLAQQLSGLVQRLKSERAALTVSHRKVHRPWGNFESVDRGDRYQVKRLTLPPGRKLSLQRHGRRAEHWVVVRGTATVTRGDDTLLLGENQSVYIPPGVVHRLANNHEGNLEVIEVQTGDYFGEDDIERFADDFGRSPSGSG
jgi:mannose-1-phosphate guanylyltransferase/mannose-6-phosphate isomerase